jgi:hypothetical protein
MIPRPLSRLVIVLVLTATLAGIGTLTNGALPVPPAHASGCDPASLICLYATSADPFDVCPPCPVVCASPCEQILAVGQDYASDPVVVSAVDSGSGLLLAQATSVTNAKGTFTALLALQQCPSSTVLISAVDVGTQVNSTIVKVAPNCTSVK